MDKKSIIGFVLMGVILFGFTWYQSVQFRKQQEEQRIQDSLYLVAHPNANKVVIKEDSSSAHTAKTPQVSYKDSGLSAARSSESKILCLENSKVKIQFNTKGAQPYSVKIKDYYYYNKAYDSTGLYLIKPGKSALGLDLYAGESIDTKDFNFECVSSTDTSLAFALPFAAGGSIQYTYTLHSDSYRLGLDVAFVGMKGIIPKNVSYIDLDWGVEIPRMEKGYKNEKQYSKLDYYSDGDKKITEIAKGSDKHKSVSTKVRWFAFQQQFFSAIMTSPKDFESAEFDIKYAEENDPNHLLMTASARLRQEFDQREGGDIHIPYEFYFGPNDFSTLKSMDCKYEKIIPLGGWLVGWITRFFIIPIFDFLHQYIASFGLIILIMTIILKIVVSPLAIKSYKSSAVMGVLKPEIDKLNEKYPKQEDAMKKQQATMEIYKKAGASPMSGCLPMLLQFPLLWAMFRFFPASIELRQQSFLWAEDLSAYDSILDFGFRIPLYGDHISLFALLMAVSMFIYSKMTQSQMSTDPNMKSMRFMTVWMMPIMMLFICNNLSSGLSYYYFLSNLLTMLQTFIVKKWFIHPDKILAKLKASEGKPAPKSKWQLRLEEAQKKQREIARQQAKQARR